MSNKSKIEWTEKTWNPVTGCTKISPGCKNCYAESMANRLKAIGANGYENGFELSLLPDRITQPIKRKKPTLYFVNSMSDLFHEEVPELYIDLIFNIIESTPHHTYQILTKRASRMARYFEARNVPKNAWLGVTVEDKKYGVPRINYLREINSKIRFLSIEPLLEDLGELDLSKIHWVIVGGESGVNARPVKEEWIDTVRQSCCTYGSKFFFKQWGTWGEDGERRSKKANGRVFKGRTWDELPVVIESQLEN